MSILLFCSSVTLLSSTFIGYIITSTLFKKERQIDFFIVFLISFIFLNTYYSLISLFYKLNCLPSVIIYAFGIFYSLRNKKFIYSNLKNCTTDYKNIFLSLTIILFFCICSTIPPRIYDSGLYHIQSIKWIEEYGIVKGLGNLHGRLAFNSNIFTLFAGTSMKSFFGQSIYCINLLLLSAFIFWQIHCIKKFNKENKSNFVLIHLLILIISFWGKIADLSSPSPDLYTTIIPIYIFLYYIESKEKSTQQIFYEYCFLIVLIVYSITVKLASLPLVLFFPFMIYRIRKYISFKLIVITTFCCLCIVIPWLIRNYYLSGYLIYPFPSVDIFNPIWKIPIKDVITEKQLVSSYAWIQKYDINFDKLQFITKLKIWWGLLSLFRKIILIIVFITTIIIIATYKRHKQVYLKYMDVYLISWGCFIFWFMLAPDFRFGNAYIIFCSVFLLLIFDISFITKSIFQIIENYSRLIRISFISILLIVSVLILFIYNTLIYPAKIQRTNFKGKVEMDYYLVKGIKIYYPINDDRCFDEELPCTNFKNENLRMLGSQIKDGFKVVEK